MRAFAKLSIATIASLLVPTLASADLTLLAGSHTLLPNTAGQVVTFSVSGGDAVEGLNFRIQVANGYPDVPASTPDGDGPNITAVDIIGSGLLFNPGGNTGQTDSISANQIWTSTTATDGSPASIAGSGDFARVTFDTTGFTSGSWSLLLSGTFDGDTEFPFATTNITNGTLDIPAAGSSISLSQALPGGYTNVATGGEVTVTGSNGSYLSEIDQLTSNENKASVAVNNAGDGLAAGDVLAMLWLSGSEQDKAALRAELDAAGGSVYDVLDPSDPAYVALTGSTYPGFDTLVRFFDPSPTFNPGFFNWDFAGSPEVVLDQIAVVPEPASVILIGLGLALLASRKIRRS